MIISVLAKADELYRGRARADAVKESVGLLAGLTGGIERYEAQWRLSRALFFLGQQAESVGAKRQLHAAAIGAGERAATLSSDRVEGHFWLGVNLALFAESSGGVKGARAILRARRELGRAVEICESYHGAGPLRVLGRLEHKAPWFIGGSRKRSRGYFERALQIAPANSITLVYASELAIEGGERECATIMLEKIVQSPIDPEWEFENLRDREVARSMLERLRRF